MFEDDSQEREQVEPDPLAGYEAPVHPPWRRAVVTTVGVVAAAALLAFPLWQVLDAASPEIADSGLEICNFDYCVVEDAVVAAGLELAMSELSQRLLSLDEARDLAGRLADRLDVPPVTVEVVDRIEGRTSGRYDGSTRTVLVERPIRGWVVLHEVAHTVAGGHDSDFQAVVIDLAGWWVSSAG